MTKKCHFLVIFQTPLRGVQEAISHKTQRSLVDTSGPRHGRGAHLAHQTRETRTPPWYPRVIQQGVHGSHTRVPYTVPGSQIHGARQPNTRCQAAKHSATVPGSQTQCHGAIHSATVPSTVPRCHPRCHPQCHGAIHGARVPRVYPRCQGAKGVPTVPRVYPRCQRCTHGARGVPTVAGDSVPTVAGDSVPTVAGESAHQASLANCAHQASLANCAHQASLDFQQN